jgi:hypothetical protein
MYPESKESALLEQLLTERAISDLVELALEIWLPRAESAVLAAAPPPPNASAAAEQDAQWNYLVDALILYGVTIIAADAYAKAQEVLTGVPLAVAKAIVATAKHNMPGMPTRDELARRAGAILSRRLSISVTSVELMLTANPQVRSFAQEHAQNVGQRVIDAVGRVYRRIRSGNDKATDTAAAREQAVAVFDPLDPQWQAAADEVGQTHGSGTLNAALQQAARDSGREMEVAWVAILDSHTRAAHAEANGQRRRPGVAFHVGGESLRFPGDPLGDIDNTINCRCRLFAYFTRPHPDLTAGGATSMVGRRTQQLAAEFAESMSGQPYTYNGGEPDFTGYLGAIMDELNLELFELIEPDPDELAEIEEFAGKAKNWVDACGGLPKFIKRITKHLQEKGMPESQAIATAVNVCKKMCKTGDINFPGKQNVNAGSRAEACNAVTQWEKLKACAARKKVTSSAAQEQAEEWVESLADEPEVTAAAPVSEKVASMTDYRSFTSVLAVIGTPTDDGRMFADNIELSFRDFPLPLLWQQQSSGGHINAYTVGVIESAGVVGKEVIGKGYLLQTPEADQAAVQIEHGVTGPSVDLGDVTWELRDAQGRPVTEEEYRANPDMEFVQTVTAAKILAATLVATPAFGQTSITLSGEVTKTPDAVVAAAALAQPGLIDQPVYDPALFANPEFDGPTLPHMTEDGRIMGHLAAFNVCHIGIQDACVMAPRSQTDYAWFHTAPPVKTSEGPVKVGRLTVGGGHAGPRLNPAATIAHYDNAGTCFALVHVGEDEHGVWFSGVAAPGATPEQVAAGLAAPLSGDWRNVGGNLELVAALAVNTPGFPILASGATDDTDSPLALVASLGPCAQESDPIAQLSSDSVKFTEFVRSIVTEVRAEERRAALAKTLIAEEVQRQAAALIEGAF